LAADVILIVHFAFVAFVTGGFALVWAGHFAGWPWVANRRFRSLHLAAITFVAIESMIGMVCPLTQWEDTLRGATTERSFVARGLHAILYYDLPEWVFSALYVAFAVLTALTIRLVPVRSKGPRAP
jgi:hypothetical protein